jgi:hypothetical protein
VSVNKPTGVHATNATVNALQHLQRDYETLRAHRENVEPSTARYAVITRRLADMRRQAAKLINDLNPSDTAWKSSFGLL